MKTILPVIIALSFTISFARADDLPLVDLGDPIRVADLEVRVRPERPDRPNRERSAAVKEVLDQFKAKRSEFIARQRDLARQLKGASEDDKEAVREKIRQNRAAFAEAKDDFHDDLKSATEKLKDVGRKLHEERQGSRRE
jgi:hypothetical protein